MNTTLQTTIGTLKFVQLGFNLVKRIDVVDSYNNRVQKFGAREIELKNKVKKNL